MPARTSPQADLKSQGELFGRGGHFTDVNWSFFLTWGEKNTVNCLIGLLWVLIEFELEGNEHWPGLGVHYRGPCPPPGT